MQKIVMGTLLLLSTQIITKATVQVMIEENTEINTSIVTSVYTHIEDYDTDFFKHSIKCNMLHLHNEEPENVNNIWGMFTEGVYYGRLRFNSFGYRWKNELAINGVKVRENHAIGALGGSLTYRSGYLNGFGIGVGLYATSAVGSLDDLEAYLYKSGKGSFSRYDMFNNGSDGFATFAEAYMEYKYQKSTFKFGRQKFESFLTRSNDTKMIPNTFEGLTFKSKEIPKTSLSMAYFTQQKLRDHSTFHHLLAVGDDANDPYARYNENDDSGMHFGLKKSELKARGIKDRLIVAEVKNRSIENLTLLMNYTAVPKLISSGMIQADYRMHINDWYVIPAVRMMQQFDNGAGAIGGANLKTLTQGYEDPQSLDAALYAARVDIIQDAFKLRLGYTKIADKGDIIAPWRGFPTAGFTRAMAQYNWVANTQSYMVQLDYKFESIQQFKMISRYVIQDFDDDKEGVQADSKVFTIDFLKGLGETSYYLKTRFAHVVGEDDTIIRGGFAKLDPTYNEIRFEINYLF